MRAYRGAQSARPQGMSSGEGAALKKITKPNAPLYNAKLLYLPVFAS